MAKLPDVLSVEQVAQILGVDPRTIRSYINRKRFPHAYRMDPQSNHSPYRIPKKDVEDFLAQQGKSVEDEQ
jgi:excisionase family DNA binding protein